MDHTSSPFELVSFRGLLKSLDDIKKGNFMVAQKGNKQQGGEESFVDRLFDKSRSNMLNSVRNALIYYMLTIVVHIEKFLFVLMSGYDDYVYTPLQVCLSPVCRLIPRYISFGGNKVPIFTANIVTLSRTFLILPIAWFLKYDYNWLAFWCVVFHDFLDHLDGIVAKVQRVTYPNHDDPILGGFLDAFCDKIVNVISLWTVLQTVDLNGTSTYEKFMCLFICYAVISYETVIGIVRVEDYFKAQFKKRYNIEDKNPKEKVDPKQVTAASMEGKLKEKLESTGIACLCMAISRCNENPISNGWGIGGLICLLLTLRMAHKSLMLKIKARKQTQKPKEQVEELAYKNKTAAVSADNLLHLLNTTLKRPSANEASLSEATQDSNFVQAEMKTIELSNGNAIETSNLVYRRPRNSTIYETESEVKTAEAVVCDRDSQLSTTSSTDSNNNNNNELADKVYTVGCFDLFHHGHIELLRRMRNYGKRVVVGVHDSRSIYKLKNRVPVDSTEKRMLNVKAYADEVFCVAGTDPSTFISSIVSLNENERAVYIRGDDMPNFPAKEVVESLMSVQYVPYTEGVSSTELRKRNFAHINAHDEDYLEKNS